MSDENGTRLRPTGHATRPGQRRPLCRPGPRLQAPGPRRLRAGQTSRGGLKEMLNQAFDQYIFTRVDHILNLAATQDAGYNRTASEVSAALDRLLELARALKAEQPEMTGLVMDFEAWAALESGQTAEIAYRQGLRDSSRVRQEFMTFLQQQEDGSSD
ncbi:hypothetical protein [Sporomusa termitida]|uniref:Uncharacterized protein n=1 Tax=Sporomusa termitida TaxID=2377 RepID=A0A517DR99_9FIRM|nr:hypothetical protein [Sporomusa termitida]QDR79880.1 hypothetical protein SPTER_11820 [Sporomusa termitida]